LACYADQVENNNNNNKTKYFHQYFIISLILLIKWFNKYHKLESYNNYLLHLINKMMLCHKTIKNIDLIHDFHQISTKTLNKSINTFRLIKNEKISKTMKTYFIGTISRSCSYIFRRIGNVICIR